MINIGPVQIGSYQRENYKAANLLMTQIEFDCYLLLNFPFTTAEFNFLQPLFLPQFSLLKLLLNLKLIHVLYICDFKFFMRILHSVVSFVV
jgi:hypothetical protein